MPQITFVEGRENVVRAFNLWGTEKHNWIPKVNASFFKEWETLCIYGIATLMRLSLEDEGTVGLTIERISLLITGLILPGE